MLVPFHKGNWAGVVPPLERLRPHIENDAHHHYWLGDFTDFDGSRFATLRWGATTQSTSLYIVVRALWVYQNNIGPIERLKLRNTCGLVSCVDPAHVERTDAPHTYTLSKPLQLHDGTDVVPRLSGVFVHLVPADVTHAMCGMKLRPQAGICFGHPITCRGCLDTARGRGYVLEEVS